MKKTWWAGLLAAAVLAPLILRAQGDGGKTILSLDACAFRFDASERSVEAYLALPRNRLPYEADSTGALRWTGVFELNVTRRDSAVFGKAWKVEDTAADTAAAHALTQYVDCIRLPLPAGMHTFAAACRDGKTGALLAEARLDFDVPRFPELSPCLSGVQLAGRISSNAQDKTHPFFKNTLQVTPNPQHLYSETAPFLYFYTETYNLKAAPGDTAYRFEAEVQDAAMKPAEGLEPIRRVRTAPGESAVEWGALNVGRLSSGRYMLTVRLLSPGGRMLDLKNAPFYVYSPESAPSNAVNPQKMYLSSEFLALSEAELDFDMERAVYLMRKNERSEYKKLTGEDAKRKWLFDFWRRRDSNPQTILNEFRVDYIRRIQEANNRFRSFQSEGWKTDRGRVFLTYGEPSSVMSYPNEQDMRPYDIWYFDQIQGGVQFVFVDFAQNREYRLVHSTVRGEIQNDQWRGMAEKGAF